MDAPLTNVAWIQSPEYSRDEINVRYEFRRRFTLSQRSLAKVYLAADARYRLWVNGQWLSDGPARSYPDHAYYDCISVELSAGENVILVELLHFGVDTFQYVQGEGGLCCAITLSDDATPCILTDQYWESRRATAWVQRTPRISCQQGFEEHYNALVEPNDWGSVAIALAANRTFEPRATDPLTRDYRSIEQLLQVERIREISGGWSFSLRMLFSPFPRGINLLGMAGDLACRFTCEERSLLRIYILGSVAAVYVDGEAQDLTQDFDVQYCDLDVVSGAHRIGIAIHTENYQSTDLAVGWDSENAICWIGDDHGCTWLTSGPIWQGHRNTNCFIDADAASVDAAPEYVAPFGRSIMEDSEAMREQVLALAAVGGDESFRPLDTHELHEVDAYRSIRTDKPIERLATTGQDFEPGTRLLFDLGEMTVGYLELDFESDAATVIDVFCFEHIQDAQIQYLYQEGCIAYRNSLRYTAHQGHNQFCSRQRRGFRYVQVVFREKPVRLNRLGVYEATYDPKTQASFECSDDELNRIYSVSQRTLLLCMEDTFTDCPSFEQAYWLGDARNESIYARYGYGASDLIEHSLRLAAKSLERAPLIASQCPSGWDTIIPSFSFLWGIAVWEAYWSNGNEDFLCDLYPEVKLNLENALKFCTNKGLFSVNAWNFFDWTDIDQEQATVLHNSMLLAAALMSGSQCAEVLGKADDANRFRQQRDGLVRSIEQLWDGEQGAFRDAIRSDGSLSPSVSQHTSFLALLFDLKPTADKPSLLRNCVNPPESMIRVGSPNAMFFLLEAVLREGYFEAAFEQLHFFWGNMLKAGATTFWEMIYPAEDFFPTRSHCHGWSAAPLYLLPKLFFDIEILEPAWRRIAISPRTFGLSYACATLCTPHGELSLRWERQLDGTIVTQIHAPPEITVIQKEHHEKSLLSHSR